MPLSTSVNSLSQRPASAVKVAADGFTLGVQLQPAAPLAFGGDAVVGDELAIHELYDR